MIRFLLVIIYLAFISLGLPDGLLGAAWPTMCGQMGVPVSYAGFLSVTIAGGTVVSSLLSGRLTLRFGTGRVTAFSGAMTALALIGFSVTKSYWALFIWAIPYGLGAGSVDASLNNYVALHYASRHMSWLHCMWGVGASVGPYIMGCALTAGQDWAAGYRHVGLIQVAVAAVLMLCIPAWKERSNTLAEGTEASAAAPGLRQILAIPGAREVMTAFFCYCGLEGTAMLWGGTYLVQQAGMSEEQAAALASMFFIGITSGRFLSGFITYKLSDTAMIRLGQGVIGVGIAVMLLPVGELAAVLGLLLIGLGCAPIYPCIIHSTPAHFGPERSQALIGVQMASAYLGTLLMPPVFGILANHIRGTLMPAFLAAILAVMVVMCERLNRKCA